MEKQSIKEQILERYPEEEFVFMDGYDDCIIGVDDRNTLIVYSAKLIINKLIKEYNFTEEQAIHHYSYTIGDIYLGEKTPILVDDYFI